MPPHQHHYFSPYWHQLELCIWGNYVLSASSALSASYHKSRRLSSEQVISVLVLGCHCIGKGPICQRAVKSSITSFPIGQLNRSSAAVSLGHVKSGDYTYNRITTTSEHAILFLVDLITVSQCFLWRTCPVFCILTHFTRFSKWTPKYPQLDTEIVPCMPSNATSPMWIYPSRWERLD
jgi:hypothetical protein